MLAHRHGSAVSVGLRHQACAGWHLDSTAVLSKIFWKFYRFLDDGASARNRTAGENKTGENADMSTGKRAVVTGGAYGIWLAFCKRLAAQGANIVIADGADCSETVGAIKKSGGAAIAVRCDQTSEADVAKLRAAVETELGGCEILVHCAGIYPTAAIDEITFDQWRKVLSVNLNSVFLLVKAFLPAMKEQALGPHHQRLLHDLSFRHRFQHALYREQGRLDRIRAVAGVRGRRFRDHGQYHRARADADRHHTARPE